MAPRYAPSVAALVTKHGKERVIAPILLQRLGLRVGLASLVDTDLFGTFSHEFERQGSALDAARAKIAAGFEYAPLARFGVASEGSFGPHPTVPFLACGRELVLLVDRESGLELAGHDLDPGTNYAHVVLERASDAIDFATRIGFPEQGLIVLASVDQRPAPDIYLQKDAVTIEAYIQAVSEALSRTGHAWVETDMRAHRNPPRMKAIERATLDLVRRYERRCPACGSPGFSATMWEKGLPCRACGAPTLEIKAEIVRCPGCGFRKLEPSKLEAADPGQCSSCNP